MPGIFGIVDSRNKIISIELANSMRKILRHDPSYKDYLYVSDYCVVGGSTPDYMNAITQPVYNEGKTLCLVMEGEIFNSDELKKELKNNDCPFEPESDAELMLELYQAYGDNLVHKVNGSFILALWDSRENCVTFINDRLGMYYLYYSTCKNRLLFAPEIKALLCDSTIKRNLDPGSVADFFSFGFVLGNKSFIKGIKLMLPGSIMRYKKGNLSIETYWNFPFKQDHPRRSVADYIEELDHILNQAVERQTRHGNNFGIALSGGLDSRFIAGYVSRKVNPIFTFTFGDEGTDEVIYAERVAAKIGSHHQKIKYSLADFKSAFDKIVWLTEGLINTSEYYYLARAIGKEVDVAFSGHGGDDLSGRLLTRAIYKAKDQEKVKDLIFSQSIKRMIPYNNSENFFSKDYYKIIKGMARKNFNEAFSCIQTEVPANIQLCFQLNNTVWRQFTRIVDLPRLYIRYRHPFLDYKVLDFILMLPPKMRLDAKVYKLLLIKKFPELADIPLPNQRASIKIEQHLRTYYALRNLLGKFLLRKWYKFFKTFAPPESEISHNVEAYRSHLKTMVHSIILDGNRKRGYFNQNYIEQILSAHLSRKKNNSFLMHKLITFELFHRLLLDEDQLMPPINALF